MSDLKKQELIKKAKHAKLSDIDFWEEVTEYFSPEETKTLRELVIGEIEINHHKLTVDNFKVRQKKVSDERINRVFSRIIAAQIRELFGDPWEYLEDKNSEGLISLTEEDLEE